MRIFSLFVITIYYRQLNKNAFMEHDISLLRIPCSGKSRVNPERANWRAYTHRKFIAYSLALLSLSRFSAPRR